MDLREAKSKGTRLKKATPEKGPTLITAKELPKDWRGFINGKRAVLFYHPGCPFSIKARAFLEKCVADEDFYIISLNNIGGKFQQGSGEELDLLFIWT